MEKLYGYINKKGEIVIKSQYKEAYPFIEKLARVKNSTI
ncbi:MAG: WG repeat-containing protein [Candidatus Goldbacteria bacterium]|nr:WG repeat-containing protein [Candidatus Goldiibacteriota bacterium]